MVRGAAPYGTRNSAANIVAAPDRAGANAMALGPIMAVDFAPKKCATWDGDGTFLATAHAIKLRQVHKNQPIDPDSW